MMSSGLTTLRTQPRNDVEQLTKRFARDRRVRIQTFLEEPAAVMLHRHLEQRSDWRQVLNSGSTLYELDRTTRAELAAPKQAALDEAVWQGARAGFQHRYESLRLPDGDGERAGDMVTPLDGLTRWLSTGPTRALLRQIAGTQDIDFADGQATAYAPGDFLTGHDDAVPGKGRIAAYVLGLTPVWRLEWGGLLLFHGDDGTVSGSMPGFNTLDLFAVPQMHSVSAVVPAAAHRRYAITGWLRAARPGHSV
jgi:Rps23 Pro-64 3,4-dihydroxylase Tpa1-like proline 4-hydroxylase